MVDSDQQDALLKTVAGVAGGALLFSPVGMPIVHGLAGLAVASLGAITVGSAIGAVTDNIGKVLTSKERDVKEYPDVIDEDEI
ncbi:MAG: hypothetical protein OQK67_00025 [Chlorobium sp.]|nr:hypothetical protein [Chlorobium sp.]MCW8814532.1 hypothetical protein [Chlorobium sp.]MCW8819812.1 hypothetical protein [Ignavibacteriaceae bacterium]